MSIKSQKSLTEECSEIFEKSYSVRSLSEESLSTEEEDSLSRELLHKLSPAVLSTLRRRFKRSKEKNSANNTSRKLEEVMRAAALQEGVQFESRAAHAADSLWLEEDAFVAAIDEIFGGRKYRAHARQLCQLLSPLRTGRVCWGALLDRLLPAERPPRAPATADRPARLRHCQRECIVKLVSLERGETFCYVAVSRGGRAGVYSGDLQLLNTYEVFQQRAAARRRVKNCWVTDAVYLSDASCVAYATSERCVRVFAAARPAHVPVHCLTALPDLPACLTYSPSMETLGSSTLLVGTVRGALCVLRFLRPRAALLQHEPDSLAYCSWTELCGGAQRSYCSARLLPVHQRAVRRVACERDARRLLSCSHDAVTSLRMRHASPHLEDYVLKVPRGVSCFHVVWAWQLVCTGSSDGVVRLWEITQSAPFARLALPAAAPVLDVAVVAHLETVVAFHNNCTLNIWDLHEESLLQTIKIRFPFLGVLGKKVEFGTYCIHPGPARRKENTEDSSQQTRSRRGSQARRGATGGLLLEDHNGVPDTLSRDVKLDPEYIRFNRAELLVTCCDCVCRVVLDGKLAGAGSILSPPGDTLKARRPSYWELPEDFISNSVRGAGPVQPHAAEGRDLRPLLDRADLHGLLEKDFVQMQGFKNDLNKKLNQMKTNMDASSWAVSSGAPHLALQPRSPEMVPAPRTSLRDYCSRLTLEFPPPSVAGTPSVSLDSTPTRSRTMKL